MLTDTSFLPPAPTNHMAQSVQHSVHQAPVSASMSTTAPSPAQQQQQQQLHRQPQPSVVMAPPPSRSSVTPTTSALTPPEENSSQQQGRKRPNVPEGNPSLKSPEKRRRTAPPTYIDLQQPGQSHVGGVANTSSSNGGGSNNNNIDAAAKAKASSNANAAAVPTPAGTPTTSPLTASAVTDSILAIAEALRKTKPAWQEQAMDIFFRDFPNEDPDLQIKIAEKALTDENKAMFFCKMPEPLRKHWVKRLREVHNRVV
ncbi:hypothetical protein QBC38DRAFT_35162 [Podospora fimiseda]|uniref:Uncharacterized protein n=1 Tax=Podospora fimiseda TaxID=252190 RepID=A0AAN7GPQ4_9PEZI|nr:hypothetical protein QBC38DRAFT_35162 [Podospora fimiseda]